MKRNIILLLVAFLLCLVPVMVFAAGAHDGLECTGCHALHTAKDGKLIFAVEENRKDVSPRTKQPYGGVTALCLGCHDTSDKGGQDIKPIVAHMSHPFGLTSVNPKVAQVPSELLRDGRFECVSCHDPHPSNTNYKYLRVDTANGAKMSSFCAVCHPAKADKSARGSKHFFSSMDERGAGESGESIQRPAASPAPARKKQQ